MIRNAETTETSARERLNIHEAIERRWALMHRPTTGNKCGPSFKAAILGFPRDTAPRNRRAFRDAVADSFRVIDSADFRVLG